MSRGAGNVARKKEIGSKKIISLERFWTATIRKRETDATVTNILLDNEGVFLSYIRGKDLVRNRVR